MQLARSGDLSVWGLLSGDDNVRRDLPVPALQVAGLGVAGLVLDEVVAGRAVPAGLEKGAARGVPGASAGSACLVPQYTSRRSAPASSVPPAVSWQAARGGRSE